MVAIAFIVVFASCEKQEIPVTPHEPGDVSSSLVEMGNDYKDQVWYSLKTNREVSRNRKISWDLAFESGPNGWHISLNTSKLMFAAPSGTTDHTLVNDTTEMDFRWDASSGSYDSTAIDDWRAEPEIFVLNLGIDEAGKAQGLRKIIFDSVTSSAYYFRYMAINGTSWETGMVGKDSTFTENYFSFKNGGEQVIVAPPKEEWDIVFTQYTFVFYDVLPITPYLVTGVLTNRYKTKAAKKFDQPFEQITRDALPAANYTEAIDEIGYDWKYYDFDEALYITHPEQNYLIKLSDDKVYKLHFLDYYNTNGEKGSPTMEFSEL